MHSRMSRFLRTFRQLHRPASRCGYFPQQRHVQVAPRAPLALGHVLEPVSHEHQRAPAVREGADHARAAADLAVKSPDCVVVPDPPPVLPREAGAVQGLGVPAAHDLRVLPEPHGLELVVDGERLGLGGLA